VVSGVVRDASGRPVAGARVYFSAGPEPFPDIAALTGPEGTFALSAPSGGTYEVTCATDAHPPASHTVAVAPGRESRVEIRLGG
jgi:hypothetical protein